MLFNTQRLSCALVFIFYQQIDSLAGKEAIVISGLKSVRRDLDEFMTYFPADVVEQAKKKIMEENELNFREFDPSLGAILNPNPTK